MKTRGWLLSCVLALTSSANVTHARDTAGPVRAAQPQSPSPRAPRAPAAGRPAPAVAAAAPEGDAPAASPSATAVAPRSTLAPDTSDSHTGNLATEQAKQLYLLGAEAFAAQRNADAIRFFRRAAELDPNPKLTYNIALAYDEMRDAGRALAEYRAFLREEPPSTEPSELSQSVTVRVQALELALAESGVQQITVLSQPSGATLALGGRAIGVTPWTLELTPGLHRLELQLPKHRRRELEVAVSRERASDVQVTLEPEPEELTVPEPGRFERITPLTWSFLGVGAAALAGGVAFEISRASSSDRREQASSPAEAAEAQGAEQAKQMASLVLLGAGTGFLVGGSVLLMLDLAEPRDESAANTQVAWPCTPGFCGLTASGRF